MADESARGDIPVYRYNNGLWQLVEWGGNSLSLEGGSLSKPSSSLETAPKDSSGNFLATAPHQRMTPTEAPPQPLIPVVFPKIKIQGVMYNDRKSFVVINNETLGEGDWIGKIQVITITRTNVILQYEGQQKPFKID